MNREAKRNLVDMCFLAGLPKWPRIAQQQFGIASPGAEQRLDEPLRHRIEAAVAIRPVREVVAAIDLRELRPIVEPEALKQRIDNRQLGIGEIDDLASD